MDAIFALAAAPRARVLERAATRIPGCLYICLWAPVIAAQLHYSSIPLRCVDAWIGGGAGGDRARVREVFEAYRRSFCAAVSGCVPGWAYKDGRPYMELPEPDLTASASLPVQEQFYHEAGTKTAVFMGCEHGEIELMLLTPPVPSSSSSSMPSLSIGSPEYSSLLRSMATTAAAAAESSSSQERLPPPPPPLPLHPAVQLPGLLPPAYGPFMGAARAEDAAIAEAMLAVISSSVPPPPASFEAHPPTPPWLARHRAQRWSPRRRQAPPGAFRAYSAALSPRARPRPGAPGQRMAKTAIALLLSVHATMRDRELAAAAAQPPPPAPAPPPPQHTSSQLHHMISERRRRERLNESFQTLRSLLPPGIKKDKATVLANTTEYMHKLIADVSELEKKNRELEAQLGLRLDTGIDDVDDSSERVVQVDVTTGASTSASTSAGQGQAQEVSIRVTVRAECDLPEVVIAMLATIKKMGSFAVVTVDARQRSSGHAQVSITLQITAGNDEPDETSLKEAVAKAVEDAVARPPSPP
ncbi:unnamed protein product [Urochloa decumbens]|uniref:BHLH domain-containing protein n=1 Tax=Urochloa decumbens TaxID=240449 RepID=A0ABC9E105_9POAL